MGGERNENIVTRFHSFDDLADVNYWAMNLLPADLHTAKLRTVHTFGSGTTCMEHIAHELYKDSIQYEAFDEQAIDKFNIQQSCSTILTTKEKRFRKHANYLESRGQSHIVILFAA